MSRTINLTHAAPWQEIRTTARDWEIAGRDNLLGMLHHLNLIRAFEEAVLDLASEQLVHGPAQSSLGQEGVAVGAMTGICLFVSSSRTTKLRWPHGPTSQPATPGCHRAAAPRASRLSRLMGWTRWR